MNLATEPVLERLIGDDTQRCLAAAFCTYALDCAFFEQRILRAVLRLSADPVDDAPSYWEEGRRVLQDVPVVCIADASMCGPGHRLPFDLLLVRSRTFHPKLALLLFEDKARLLVGSGNLTEGGYGGNAELCFARELYYGEPADAALLASVGEFLKAAGLLTAQPGMQLALFQKELTRRLSMYPPTLVASSTLRFLHTEQRASLLSQFLDLVPAEATIQRIGVLAPFFEEDDKDASDPGGVFSVLQTLVKSRGGAPRVDLGLYWEGAPIMPPAEPSLFPFKERLNSLWAWVCSATGEALRIDYMTPTRVADGKLHYLDAAGLARARPLQEAIELRKRGHAWPIEPMVYGPEHIVASLILQAESVRVWLFPDRQLVDGKPRRRPLHAKLLLVTAEHRGQTTTYVLQGSPNASRRALLLTPGRGGNVETAVAYRLEGKVTIRDFAPELVYTRQRDGLCERKYSITEDDSLPEIASVLHDPVEGTLTLTWHPGSLYPRGRWKLLYNNKLLTAGAGPSATPLTVRDFVLSSSSCEVVLEVGGRQHYFPIIVRDLAVLPIGAEVRDLGLREALALLSRRLTREQIGAGRQKRTSGTGMSALDQLFGESFGPPDVFRAWFGLKADLAHASLSVPAFRTRIEGPAGARAVWRCMLRAVSKGLPAAAVEAEMLSSEEAWFYGLELLQTLKSIQFVDDAAGHDKSALLDSFLDSLRTDLDGLPMDASDGTWMTPIRSFYGV